MAVGAVLVGLGSALLALSSGGGAGAVAAVPAVAAVGSVAYLAGVVAWEGRAGHLLRLAGWLAMVATAAIPSQLTLVLPLVATLVAAVHRAPEGGRRRTPGRQGVR